MTTTTGQHSGRYNRGGAGTKAGIITAGYGTAAAPTAAWLRLRAGSIPWWVSVWRRLPLGQAKAYCGSSVVGTVGGGLRGGNGYGGYYSRYFLVLPRVHGNYGYTRPTVVYSDDYQSAR